LSEKDKKTLKKLQNFNDCQDYQDINHSISDRYIEKCPYDNQGEEQCTFDRGNVKKRPHPLSVLFTIKEHHVDYRIQQGFHQEIDNRYSQEDGNQMILGV
jgi:hypothetical protein